VTHRFPKRFVALLLPIGAGLALCVGALTLLSGPASASAPAVVLSPQPKSGQFESGQTIQVSVGANSTFPAHSLIVILACADPGGDSAHLPVSLGTCDENSVQGDTVLVGADGSFTEKSYPVYSLPNAIFGEQSNWQPVCNATNQCVLFVGEDQNDFTKPKVFSAPFAVAGVAATASTATTTPSTTVTTTANTPTSAVSAQVSLPAATLAFTGWSPWVTVVAFAGFALLALSTCLWFAVRRWGR
jgi:hypothetical protein